MKTISTQFPHVRRTFVSTIALLSVLILAGYTAGPVTHTVAHAAPPAAGAAGYWTGYWTWDPATHSWHWTWVWVWTPGDYVTS